MGAVMPPRLGVQTWRPEKKAPTLTRFTPAVNGGILSLYQDRDTSTPLRLRAEVERADRSGLTDGCRWISHHNRLAVAPLGTGWDRVGDQPNTNDSVFTNTKVTTWENRARQD